MHKRGYFGAFGGQFVPELLMPALIDLEQAFNRFRRDTEFQKELFDLYKNYAGRPTPLYEARNLSKKNEPGRIFLKREDLMHTGSHKLNNCLGQGLMARKMGFKQVIAETGAGQHGVATATACALLGLQCRVFMGTEDINRQRLNVYRMQLLGAEVVPVESGSATLKDAINEAMRYWAATVKNTAYIIGSVIGPHPYPLMVREFQSVIGMECRSQLQDYGLYKPDYVVACVGGGSNAMGIFHPFKDSGAQLIGVEAGGRGDAMGDHAASLNRGSVGVFHGVNSYFLQDEYGQIVEAHSVSAGLDYPGVGPEHAYYKENGLAQYVTITDEQALAAFHELSRVEGIIPALESSHAVAYAIQLAQSCKEKKIILVNLSGRGDKDLTQTIAVQE